MPSAGINGGVQGVASQTVSICGELVHMEHMHQRNNQELTDGVTSMETACEHASAESISRGESDNGRKKRRVEENTSADGVVADCSPHESGDVRLEDSSTMENAGSRDYFGAPAATTNASFAESVIEPTLVMFEVVFEGFSKSQLSIYINFLGFLLSHFVALLFSLLLSKF